MKKNVIFSFLVLFLLSGCILAPAIDSVKRAGITKNDRIKLLSEQIKYFHEALYWGNPDEALSFATDEDRTSLREVVSDMSGNERTVESKVYSTEVSDNGYDAVVRVKVKAYKVPFYVVNERIDEQVWTFEVGSGWKLKSLKRGGS